MCARVRTRVGRPSVGGVDLAVVGLAEAFVEQFEIVAFAVGGIDVAERGGEGGEVGARGLARVAGGGGERLGGGRAKLRGVEAREQQRAGKAGYTCGSNDYNAARHIWDMRDANGHMGAMACVVVPAFHDAHPGEGGWQVLAQWIHDHLDYGSLYFFPNLWAVNIGWHEAPARTIDSYAAPKGRWTPH